jgi:hypothetical protein
MSKFAKTAAAWRAIEDARTAAHAEKLSSNPTAYLRSQLRAILDADLTREELVRAHVLLSAVLEETSPEQPE